MASASISRRTCLTAALPALMLALYAAAALRLPDGGWDAWAFWNTRAKFFLLDPAGAWSPTLPHPDYPPLLPLMVAWGWRLAGMTPLVPMALHGAVYALLLALLWLDPSTRRRGWALPLVGFTALPYAVTQFADVPLSVALLGAVMAWQHRREAWTGAALGIGLLLKNEGAWLALAWLMMATVWERRFPWRAALALLPWGLILAGYKLLAASPNDLMSAAGVVERLTTLVRYPLIAVMAIGGGIGFGGGALLILALILYLERRRVRWTMPLAALAVMAIGYLAVYILTPHDVVWHMMSSWDRLILQLFPALVYAVIVAGDDANHRAADCEALR